VNHPETFWHQAKHARKLLVLDLGFLGDTVHLLPALWRVRQAWPDAELHVMVAEHIMPLLELVPWVNQVWGYPRFPKGPKPWQDWGRIRRMREARFDAVLNLNGSDRSSFLTFASGAPLRLGRCNVLSFKNRFLFTHPLVFPRGGKMVARQHCDFIHRAGVPGAGQAGELEYQITIPERIRNSVVEKLGLGCGWARCAVHVSPFTTQDKKELPPAVLAGALNLIYRQLPDVPLVISCANNEREQAKLQQLLGLLNFVPHRVFAGNLGLLELVGVLGVSRLHLGGDSGGLHVAVMAGTPTVSWFRRYAGAVEWQPDSACHQVLLGEESDSGVQEITADSLVNAVMNLLDSEHAPKT
jgi:ADP-heptose:LPS heptosyltransferase